MAKETRAYPSTEREFKARFPNADQNTLHGLSRFRRNASGSNWSVSHLEACRVLFKPCSNLLGLESHIRAARQTIRSLEVLEHLTILTKPPPPDAKSMCHRELRQAGGDFGSFYVGLSDVICMPDESALNSRTSSTRERNPAIRLPEYKTGEGLSSPPIAGELSNPVPSSSPYQQSSQGDDDFEAQLDRTRDEAVSADLAVEFISCVLDLFLGPTHIQTHGQSPFRIEFSKEPTTFILQTHTLTFTCMDYGSVVKRKKMPFRTTWSGTKVRLCSLEVKAKYSNTDVSSGKATTSDRVLAQLTCEMLGGLMDHICRLKNHIDSLNDLTPSKRNSEDNIGRSPESFLESYQRLV